MSECQNRFPGPCCEAANITCQQLKSRDLPQNVILTNGLVLELHSFVTTENLTSAAFVKILEKLDSNFCGIVHPSALVIKVKRVIEQKKKLSHRKKVKGFKTVKELLDQTFSAPVSSSASNSKGFDSTVPCLESSQSQNVETDVSETQHLEKDLSNNGHSLKSVHSQTEEAFETDGSPIKTLNLVKYKQTVLLKQNKILTRKLIAKRLLLKKVDDSVGHYSVRNINKRDETAKKNLHLLRDTQRTNIRLEKNNAKNKKLIETYKKTEKELKERIKFLEKENEEIRETRTTLSDQMQVEKEKKIMSQKANSYLRSEVRELKEKVDSLSDADHEECNSKIIKLQLIAEEKEHEINSLQQDLDEANEALRTNEKKVATKNSDGSFADNFRLCVMELAGLEVAVEKVSPVIKCISKHLFSQELEKEALPCPSTVQSIVDEGQFIAKTFIAEKILNSENWGLGRDGTTRKKQKIVDTSVTLDSGDVMSLGFTRVASETAETIQSVTKNQIKELGNLSKKPTEEFIAESLIKLSFTMSDRASNEKLADKLLDDWKEEMLENVEEPSPIHHLHCMAHVLLGFHNYLSPELKQMEAKLTESNGPIGRDALPVFRSWSKKETFVGRTVRTTSDVFGPAADHHGIRDRWEAYCSTNGIKSRIGNYRDNRFNALFQTSAEVFLHRQDFLTVLETVEKPNLKLQSVKSDLKSTEVCALLQCLGLFYLKLTGPYWNLITSGKVPYYELYKHVQDIQTFLEQCEQSPETLLLSDRHWIETDPIEISMVQENQGLADCLFTLHEDSRELLLTSIPLVAKAFLKTVNKQLVDFLPGGKYCDAIASSDQDRIKFAPLTNLSCEHHFGDLDSSQRRRPHASFHHHSSIQLLKRNRNHLMQWVEDLDPSGREDLLMRARKGGRDLRKNHLEEEKNVLTKINEKMFQINEKDKKRKNTSKSESKSKKLKGNTQESKNIELTKIEHLTVGECVAVAYQDNWYPGYVEKIVDTTTAVVKFMTHCRKPGYFQWPLREDKQVVNIQFVIGQKLVPDCINAGRQWFICEHKHLNTVFSRFSSDFFC
ncbi:uncharacterized protein LOC123533110 [Mercenaria mercenaria]|uniref:uncharacterized protein LOC123533110 n=1 Tax=Mercenaria mercenaria TaxID=6596 RepID=UPI00234EEAA9|nr:uncharacterized protein LOC123533110 [Mercenaria mercenaria]